MNEPRQVIQNPFGVTVFGSTTIRIPPDIASIRASVSNIEPKPGDAFSKAKRGARSVQDYLRTLPIAEFGASRVALTSQYRFISGENRFIGYQARISFRIKLTELDRVDEIAESLIGAGANEIESISFETSKLRELRAEARQAAVHAARAKALNYCAAAGVTLGHVLHIEDVNPITLRFNESAHAARGGGGGMTPSDDGHEGSLDPSLIEIGGAVYVAYAFGKAD